MTLDCNMPQNFILTMEASMGEAALKNTPTLMALSLKIPESSFI